MQISTQQGMPTKPNHIAKSQLWRIRRYTHLKTRQNFCTPNLTNSPLTTLFFYSNKQSPPLTTLTCFFGQESECTEDPCRRPFDVLQQATHGTSFGAKTLAFLLGGAATISDPAPGGFKDTTWPSLELDAAPGGQGVTVETSSGVSATPDMGIGKKGIGLGHAKRKKQKNKPSKYRIKNDG